MVKNTLLIVGLSVLVGYMIALAVLDSQPELAAEPIKHERLLQFRPTEARCGRIITEACADE